MHTFRKFFSVLLLTSFLVVPTGCAVLAAALPKVIAAVTEASAILDAIDSVVSAFLVRQPQDWSEDYAQKMAATRRSLAVAVKTAEAAEKLSQDDVDAAFADFREAYADLTALLSDAGMIGADGTLKASPNGPPQIDVPDPMALSLKID